MVQFVLSGCGTQATGDNYSAPHHVFTRDLNLRCRLLCLEAQ